MTVSDLSMSTLQPTSDLSSLLGPLGDRPEALPKQPTANLRVQSQPGGTITARQTPPPERNDTRVAFALPAVPVALVGAAIVGAAFIAYETCWQDSDGKTVAQKQGEIIFKAAQDVWNVLNETGGRLGMEVPSVERLQQMIGDAFRKAHDGVGSIGDLARNLMEGLTGSNPAPTLPAPVQTQPAPVRPPASTRTDVPDAFGSAPPRTVPTPLDVSSLPIVQQQQTLASHGGDQAARASQLLEGANPLIDGANDALRQFYFAASGGTAARVARLPQAQVQAVQRLRDEIQQIVRTSNDPVAAVASAAASLQAIFGNAENARFLAPNIASVIRDLRTSATNLAAARDVLKDLVASLDAWLPAAYRFSADGTQPLPTPPRTTYTPPGQNPARVGADLNDAARAAQTVLNGSGARPRTGGASLPASQPQVATPITTTPTAATSSAPAMPAVEWVNEMPAEVRSVAQVWINPRTREVTHTSHAGDPQWVGMELGSISDDLPGQLAVIPKQGPAGKLFARLFGGGGGKGPDKTDLLLLLFAGNLAVALRSQSQQDAALTPPPTTAIRSWQPVSPVSTPEEKASAIVSAWTHYAGQIQDRLRSDGVADRLTTSGGTFADEVRAYVDDKIAGLKSNQARLVAATNPQDKAGVLAAMADFTLPRTTFNLQQSFPRNIVPDASVNRPNVTLNALIDEVNQQAANDMRSIVRAPGLAATSAPQASTTQGTQPPVTPQTPARPTVDPAAADRVLRLLTTPPAQRPAQPVPATPVPNTGVAAAPQKLNTQQALGQVGQAIQAQGVASPPPTDTFANVRFTLGMFLDLSPNAPKTYEAISAAHARATRLFVKLGDIHAQCDPLEQTQIADVMRSIDTGVLQPLARMARELPSSSDTANPGVAVPEQPATATPTATPTVTPTVPATSPGNPATPSRPAQP